VVNDPEIAGRVPRAKIERAFDLKRQLKNIDKIFARVFGEPSKHAAAPRSRRERSAGARKRA